jgi:hypothetical protein
MSSRRTYLLPRQWHPCAPIHAITVADKFARSEHPVKFSSELVDKLQKNTFVRHLKSRSKLYRISNTPRPTPPAPANKNSNTKNA